MHTTIYRTGTRPKPAKKRRSWRRRLVAFGIVALAIYVGAVSWITPAHAVAGITSAGAYPEISTKVMLNWPDEGQAAVGAEGYGILAANHTDQAVPTASVIKLVTALSVLQKHPLAPNEAGPTITMTEQDAELYNWYFANHGSVIPIRAGQQLTERQALDALMLRSANNMADTLARWAFGSFENYQQFATSYLAQLGMSQTVIGSDASGLNPSSVSTASDLVKLGMAAMKNPALAQIVGQKSAVIPEVGTIYNTNSLLGVRNIVGVKTGNNDQDKGAYVFASNYQTPSGKVVQIVGAVMGSSSIEVAKQNALALLVSTEQGFTTRTLYHAGDVVGSFQPAWLSQPVKAKVASDVDVLGWRGTPLRLNIALDTITAPISADAQVGTITVGTGDLQRVVGKVVLDQSIARPSMWWRMTHPVISRQVSAE